MVFSLFLRYLVLALPLLLSACSSIKTQSESGATPAPNLLVISSPEMVSSSALELNKNSSVDLAETSNLWDRVRNQFSLDLELQSSRIDSELKWFARHQSYINRVSDRSARYLYFIMEQIEARGMPGEMALLPIVESAFEPFAYSHGRAAGVWQFIPSTGHVYGLQQDWWHDGRRDIRRSTIAALKFLEGLSREFDGDWMLALAAYNSGAGTVRKAIRKNKRQGLPTDFLSLSLPKETRAYAPKLIALARLLKHPQKYGVTFPDIANTPYFSVIETGGQMDLSQAAEMADVELEEIYRLNPQYNQWATSPNGPHELLVPISQQEIFKARLSELPADQRIKWQRYKIKSGDSLISIARKFHTTPDALKQVNSIRNNLLRAGKMLLIPTAFKSPKSYAYSAANRLSKKQALTRGAKGSKKLSYTVRSGDSFWSLSKEHDVSVGRIAKWNGMAPKDPLKTGQKLVIWSNTEKINKNREIIRKIRYRVRNGDSLHLIADKFNVQVKDIKRWNQLKKNKYLQPGDRLVLYIDVTQAS
ncbi:MAG: membrane-bound lytic murein transglycosylase D [Crocinitomicaceae bacterium]